MSPLAGVAVAASVAVTLALAPLPLSIAGAALGVLALWVARVDCREYRIPDAATSAMALLGLIVAALSDVDDWRLAVGEAIARGLALFLLFFGFRWLYARLRGRNGLGLGDVKLAGVAGVWLPAPALAPCIELACAAAALFLLARGAATGEPFAWGARLPFGAFLGPALWATWLFVAWAR